MTIPPPPTPTTPPKPPEAHGEPFTLAAGQRAKLQFGPTLSVEALAGTSFVLVVEIAGYRSPVRIPMDLGAGRVAWTPDNVRITATQLAIDKVQLTADRVDGSVRPEPAITARIERGGTLRLSDEVELVFRGHGHKRVYEGESSPLMVTVAFRGRGLPEEDSHYNVGDESGPQRFAWRDYRFTITDYGYDVYMQLAIERLAFVPVGLEAP